MPTPARSSPGRRAPRSRPAGPRSAARGGAPASGRIRRSRARPPASASSAAGPRASQLRDLRRKPSPLAHRALSSHGRPRARRAQRSSALAAGCSGSIRCTSQTSPARSSAEISRPEMSSSPPAHAVEGGGGEGVVVVVPRLAEGQRRQPQQVARLIVGRKAPAAEEVTQRVDAVGHVVQHARCAPRPPTAAPRAPRPRVPPISTPRPNGIARPTSDHSTNVTVDEADHRVGEQVGREALAGAALGVVEQPADVGMGEAAQRSPPAAAVSTCGLCGSPRRSE